MTDLQDAVTELTASVVEHYAQIGDDGKWIRTHTVEHPPLLRQLEQAATPTPVNDGGGAKALPAHRSPVDLNALYEYSKIASQIKDWCIRAGVAFTRPPKVDRVSDLQAWADTVGGEVDESWFVGQMLSWVLKIRDVLDPGDRIESDYPCPICKSTAWGNAIDGGSMRAIEIRYRLDDSGRLYDERAMCRGSMPDGSRCATVWVGHESVMELAEEQHEAAR